MVKKIEDCTGVILAGGENTRLSFRKAFIEIMGEKIIERQLHLIKRLFSDVLIITNEPAFYTQFNIPLIGDVYQIRGPMTGIYTALLNSKNKWIFVTACDMPFINESLVSYMSSKRDNYSVVLPKYSQTLEPLFAFYAKDIAPEMETALLKGEKKMQLFFYNKRVKYIYNKEIEQFDRDGKIFFNINTYEDLLYLN